MEYKIYGDKDNRTFLLSYPNLKKQYLEIRFMDDEEFLANIPRILHFVCIISYLKEYGHFMFSDMGLVHELVHILHLGERETVQSLKEIRKKFDKLMELV